MCRLLGIAASEPTDFRIVLREAPRSLATLSREHRDGWGIAVFDEEAGGWRLDKGIACAGEDERFHRLAVGSRGEVLVSHVRRKTVGETSLTNTHPFERGRWVFAHNGTVEDVTWLRGRASRERLAELRGETDSELLFAWLLTRLDEAGVTHTAATWDTDRAIGKAVRVARERPGAPGSGRSTSSCRTAARCTPTASVARCTCSSAARTTPSGHDGRAATGPSSRRHGHSDAPVCSSPRSR